MKIHLDVAINDASSQGNSCTHHILSGMQRKNGLRHNERSRELKRSDKLDSTYSTTATHSISTSTFLGNVLTATQLLAGLGFPNALIVSLRQIPVIPAHKLHSSLQSLSYLLETH